MVTQTYYLHMVPDVVTPTIYLEQYDSNLVTLYFNLIGDSDYYTIPSGTYVTLVGSKPDGTAFSYACTWSGHTVTAVVTEQMTVVPGIVKAQLRFTDNSGVGVLSSIDLKVVINRSPLQGLYCSKNEFTSIDGELIDIRASVVEAKSYKDGAETYYNQTVSTASQAVTDIANKESEAEAAFDEAVSYVQQYGTAGVVFSYQTSDNSLIIRSVTA